MMRLSVTYFSWFALAAALVLWAGVSFLAWTVTEEQAAREERALQTEEEIARQATQLQILTLARETAQERTQLEELARKGLVEIVDLIEGVGTDSGAQLRVGGVTAVPAPATGPRRVGSVAFVVEAEGSFAQVSHALALLETFPVPSAIGSADFEFIPSVGTGRAGAGTWRLVLRMQTFTTTDLSSS